MDDPDVRQRSFEVGASAFVCQGGGRRRLAVDRQASVCRRRLIHPLGAGLRRQLAAGARAYRPKSNLLPVTSPQRQPLPRFRQHDKEARHAGSIVTAPGASFRAGAGGARVARDRGSGPARRQAGLHPHRGPRPHVGRAERLHRGRRLHRRRRVPVDAHFRSDERGRGPGDGLHQPRRQGDGRNGHRPEQDSASGKVGGWKAVAHARPARPERRPV